MFWLKKKIAMFRQYFSNISSEDGFRNKFNFVFKNTSLNLPEGVLSPLILDECYSFLKNRYWYKSCLFRQIMVNKISLEYGIGTDQSEELFEGFLNFFKEELAEFNFESSSTVEERGSDLNFVKYICVMILATSDLDLDKDENYNVYELGVGKDILDKVKNISVEYSDILDKDSKYFLSDLDKNILLALEQIALGVDKNLYYIDIELLSYALMDFFCRNAVDSSNIFNISNEVFNMLVSFSQKASYSLPKGDNIPSKFPGLKKYLSEELIEKLMDFLVEQNFIYKKASGIATKYTLAVQAQNIISSAYSDKFLKGFYNIDSILKLAGPYQVKVLSRLKDVDKAMFLKIFNEHLSDLPALSLQVCCKYMNTIKEESGVTSDDIIDRISFLKDRSLNGINVAIYDRISTIILGR